MKNAANFEVGANYFYITVNTPQPYDPSTGLMKFDRNDMISGYYVVREVASEFRDGQFLQKLNGIRDVGIVTPFIAKSDAQLAAEIRKEDEAKKKQENKK